MAKNYASIYDTALDSTALNQSVYIKKETVNGTMEVPTGSDFVFVLSGGTQTFQQPLESSPHRSGRHNNNTIKKKKSLEWNYPTFCNIKTDVVAGATQLESGVSSLWESVLGRKVEDAQGVHFDSANDPSTTLTIHEIGDQWSKQAYGCFVDSVEISLPGDGESQFNWSGMGIESYLVGIGKSTVTNDANTVTLETGEGKRFPIGSQVMIIKDDGTTRSTDTADGMPRTVTAVAGDVVTLDGAALADADGTTNPIYLVYYEAETPVGIDNPQTGLVGQFVSATMGGQCVRSATINVTNGHELVNYCFGTDALSGSHYIPGGRLEVEASIEINLSKKNVGIYNDIQAFEPQDIKFILGDSTTRHFAVSLPRVECSVPTISVPESGSIPITFEGKAYQTALDAADEIKVDYL